MAYTKKTWECGETITADALNRMEDGIDEALQSGGVQQDIAAQRRKLC